MIPIGTYVIVRYDPTAQVRNEIAHRYNGAEGKVTRARNWGAHGAYYEIEGIVSQLGVPYTFVESDLVEV